VLVEVGCDNAAVSKDERLATFIKDVAMHIAAASPQYLQRSEVPSDVLEREKDIYRDKARQTGKPENIIEKIIEGQINKFYGDICLLEQAYVKDPDKTVQQYMAETGKALGSNLTLKRFTKFVLGEGLEKRKRTLPRKWRRSPASKITRKRRSEQPRFRIRRQYGASSLQAGIIETVR